MRTWILRGLFVLTNLLILLSGLFGLWVTAINFGYNDWGPPSPPPNVTTTTTTTTTTATTTESLDNYRFYNNRYDDQNKEVPYKETEAYRAYVSQMDRYANLMAEPRLYLAVPSGLVCLISILMILFSPTIFTTTATLYTTGVMWVLVLLATITYQINFYRYGSQFIFCTSWMIGEQVYMLVILIIQAMVLMKGLRSQKSGWPCLNITSLFTIDMLLLVARMVLSIFLLRFLFGSAMLGGMFEVVRDIYSPNDGDVDWSGPNYRYPLWLALTAVMATFYNIMVVLEMTLSTLMGVVQKRWAWLTTLFSAIGISYVAVLSSPAFVQTQIGPYYVYPSFMIIAIITAIFNFLHLMAYSFLSDFIRTPPKIIRYVAENVSWRDVMSVLNLSGIGGNIKSGAQGLLDKKPGNALIHHIIMITINVFLAIFLATFWEGPMYGAWGAAILLGVNIAGIIRSLPPIVLNTYYKQTIELESLTERTIRTILKLVLVLIGAIGLFVSYWRAGLQIIAGINLICILWQCLVLLNERKQNKKKSMSDDANTNGTSKLVEEMETDTEEEEGESKEMGKTRKLEDPVSLA